MVTCCVPFCRNSARQCSNFIPVPKSKKLRAIWAQVISSHCGVSPVMSAKSHICSEHFGFDQWTRKAHKLKPNAVPRKFKLCISKYCEDVVLFQSKEAKLVGHRTKSALPCCLCFDRLSESGVELNSSDGSSHKQGCLLQQYYNEHDDQKQLKIMEYARDRNVELREQIAAIQAKLISLGAS
ncbi:uncharacterized protein LOC117653353 [Thrips palmi]|uniref:Uncharacterized protein LOC117642599 n=1 Tax=Thrips palmi TaxID=161013 RepID=A0A6P8YJA6_THRPL|nr:uncharacterized protein LOC117642599 [Thrips palmi]XP_034254872.1 uncharacterized protein LOC117653353 [Thrips palmi]